MKYTKKTRSTLFFLLSTFILLLACFSTLLWQNQQQRRTQAADISFVVAPTLPAATVDSILANMGSPMVGVGNVVEQASQNYQIDDAFALAVWNVETSEGAAGVGRSYLNPGGVRASPAYSSGLGGYTLYPTYAEGVQDWFRIVRDRYVDRGLYSVYTLCVPYVGTSHAYEWAAKVSNLMQRFRNQAPPPTPTPTPLIYDKQLAMADARMLQAAKTVSAHKLQINNTIIHPQPQHASSSDEHQPLAFALILLIALGIALAALFFGKKGLTIPVQELERRYEPLTPLPFETPYSHLLEPDTMPQLPAYLPINLPIDLPIDLPNRIQPLGLPSLANPVRLTQALSEVGQLQRGGLLKRYATTESLEEAQEKKAVSRITEDLAYRQMLEVAQKEKVVSRITEDLAYRQMLEVSERVPAGVGIAPTAFRRPRRLVPLNPDSN